MQRGRWLAVALVVIVLALAYRTGLLAQLAEPAQLRQTLLALGPWGYVGFVLAYAVLQPFGLPGTVFVVAAPLIWSWPVAFVLSMTGTMAASIVGFSFARYVARDWVAARIPERFRRYDAALERHAFATVFVLRFLFWMPPLLHAFFGVSRVRFATHAWGSAAGYLLPLLLMSYFGQALFDAARRVPPGVWIGAAVAVLVAIAVASVLNARRRARR